MAFKILIRFNICHIDHNQKQKQLYSNGPQENFRIVIYRVFSLPQLKRKLNNMLWL